MPTVWSLTKSRPDLSLAGLNLRSYNHAVVSFEALFNLVWSIAKLDVRVIVTSIAF